MEKYKDKIKSILNRRIKLSIAMKQAWAEAKSGKFSILSIEKQVA